MKGVGLVVSLVLVAATSAYGGAAFVKDRMHYQTEAKCISKLVSYGIQRNSIWTSNGTCGVKLHSRAWEG